MKAIANSDLNGNSEWEGLLCAAERPAPSASGRGIHLHSPFTLQHNRRQITHEHRLRRQLPRSMDSNRSLKPVGGDVALHGTPAVVKFARPSRGHPLIECIRRPVVFANSDPHYGRRHAPRIVRSRCLAAQGRPECPRFLEKLQSPIRVLRGNKSAADRLLLHAAVFANFSATPRQRWEQSRFAGRLLLRWLWDVAVTCC